MSYLLPSSFQEQWEEGKLFYEEDYNLVKDGVGVGTGAGFWFRLKV